MADRRLDLRRSHHRSGMAFEAELVRGVEERLHHQSRSRTLPSQAHERHHDRARCRPPLAGVASEGGVEFDPGSGGVWAELSGASHGAKAPECSGAFCFAPLSPPRRPGEGQDPLPQGRVWRKFGVRYSRVIQMMHLAVWVLAFARTTPLV